MIRGVIFDMDGVLADSEPLHARSWVTLLARHGVGVDESFLDPYIGTPNLETAQDVVRRFRLSLTAQELVVERQALYLELVERELHPFRGLAESLAGLALPMAVATSSSRADAARTLSLLRLSSLFRAVVTVEDVGRPKPDPEIYAAAARRLGLAPGDCAAVEDSPTGVASARSAGCYVVAVTTTHAADRLAAAHQVLADTVSAIEVVAAMARAG